MSGVRWFQALCVLMLLAAVAPPATAQDFDFHPPASATAPTAPAVMRDLAERMLPVYQEDNPERYLANLSALQLVAGNFTAAYESRQSLRDRRRSTDAGRPVGRGLILDIYAHARAIEATDRMPFAQAFAKAYRDAIPKLNDLDAYAFMGWLGTAPTSFQELVQRIFDQHRAKGNIALAEAVDLVQTYATFDAYRSFGPIVGALDAEDEQRRYATEDDVVIKVRKAVSIAALIIRPKGPQKPLPALLEYTPYLTPGYAREAAAHGYVGVIAYSRGRGKSTGTPLPYQHDGDDVRAVINWIAKQSWSDGRVGMYGTAYSGFTGWAAAKHLPPALKAIAMTSPTAPGIDVPDDGGVFRNSAYRWSLYLSNAIDDKTYNDDAPWRSLDQRWYTSGKPYREFGSLYGTPNPFFLRWLNHPSYDRFWQTLIPYGREFAKVDIPVLTITGYYAAGEGGALYYFKEHRRYDPHANHTLLIGPYDDGVTQRGVPPALRGYTVDPAALVDLRELRYEWFDSVLKGAQVPALLKDRVNFEVMGANEWRHVPSIEAMSNGSWQLFLDPTAVGASHRLSEGRASGKGKGKNAAAGFVTQEVDLADRNDANSNWMPTDIAGNSVEVRNATNYVSAPLPKSLELQGAWSGRLDLTVNKMDVDLRLAAYELLPSGEYVQLFEPYVFRASYAQDRVHRRLLRAGERQTIPFKIERLTSRKLEAGSRLVLVLGVNKRPDQEINYGGGEDVSAESLDDPDDKLPIKIRWYGDSYIDIPVRR
ncbi:MAG TPA: CocE/NonD family hydrolase [Steroidobacteraceae bacterium]